MKAHVLWLDGAVNEWRRFRRGECSKVSVEGIGLTELQDFTSKTLEDLRQNVGDRGYLAHLVEGAVEITQYRCGIPAAAALGDKLDAALAA